MQRLLYQHWNRYSRYGRRQAALSGALALLFDRAAALFGTKAAAAERHRATMRRCIFYIARRAAILPSYVLCFLPVVRARAPDPNCVEGSVGARRRCEPPPLFFTASYQTRPLRSPWRAKRAPAAGTDGEDDYSTGTPSPRAVEDK